jgi:hypothetical protein
MKIALRKARKNKTMTSENTSRITQFSV